MKLALTIFCWILAAYTIYFPLTYFGSDADKKEVRVSHILVETQEKANTLKQDIINGKNFEDIAKENSKCPSKDSQGDLGFTQRGRLDENIDKAAFKIKKNEISEPIKSNEGWHLVKVTQIKYFSDKENFKYNPYKYLDL